jgi:hypothetical protein
MPQLLDAFEVAPKLSYVVLRNEVSLLKPHFPITQLRELYLIDTWYQCTLDEFLQTLHNAHHLVKFSTDLNPESQHHLPRAIVRHSNLRELHVDTYDLDTLLECVALPALVSLSCHNLETWPEVELPSFLRRSSCSLQWLVLHACIGDTEGWMHFSTSLTKCLQHTPGLLELELLEGIGAAVGPDFWIALINQASTPCLVRKLRRIKVTRYFEFDWEAFVRMVKSRWRVRSGPGATYVAVERIRNVEVCLAGRPDMSATQQYLARLRQFRAEGLNVFAPDIDAIPVLDHQTNES